MSETPRTDKVTYDTLSGSPGVLNAVAIKKPDGSGLYVKAEFARLLEKELAAAKRNELTLP